MKIALLGAAVVVAGLWVLLVILRRASHPSDNGTECQPYQPLDPQPHEPKGTP